MRFAVNTAFIIAIIMLSPLLIAGSVESYTLVSCKDKQGVILKSFFLGDHSIEEVQKKYPERWQYLEKGCQQKLERRSLASTKKQKPVEWEKQIISSPGGQMRPFGVACFDNDQCESASCHPQLGVCQARFHYPVGISY